MTGALNQRLRPLGHATITSMKRNLFTYIAMCVSRSSIYVEMLCRRLICHRCRATITNAMLISSYSTGRNGGEVKVDNDSGGDVETFKGPIPRERLTVAYSRSSGPGGQNVNKVNTKAEVRFHIDTADWIPTRVKDRLKSMFSSRITKQGELLVVSQKHRSQMMNLNDAIARMEVMLSEASEIPKGPSHQTVARVKALKRKSERRRLVDKKYHSLKKQDRRTDDY